MTAESFVVLPRRIALGVFITLATQFGGFVWYAAKVDSRLISLEEADVRTTAGRNERYAELRSRLDLVERDRDRVTKLETKVDYIGAAVQRIEQKLDTTRRR